MTTHANRRPVLIFDFGNVIAFFDHKKAFEAIAKPRGLSADGLWQQALEAGLRAELSKYESGQVTSEAFHQTIRERLNLDVPFVEFAKAWADIFWPNTSIWPLVRQLKADGHRLILGSNTNALHAEWFRRQFDELLSLFDGWIFSFQIGHQKPGPEFYQACLELAQAPARDCLFIDDTKANVEGAEAVGLPALHYRNTPSLIEALRQRGFDLPVVEK